MGVWARDLGPNLSAAELAQYLMLWELLQDFTATPDVEDAVRWAWEPSGSYSARSAYAAKFVGRQLDPAAPLVWSSRAPLT